MTYRAKENEGFTVVELLVTLFVAALFVLSGWQLYTVVTARSAESQQESEAGNLAYSLLRSWEWGANEYASATACTSSTAATPISPLPDTGSLPEPVEIKMSRCNPIAGVNMNRIVVTVTYGPDDVEVSHGIFVAE